jgi:hypothetical protein
MRSLGVMRAVWFWSGCGTTNTVIPGERECDSIRAREGDPGVCEAREGAEFARCRPEDFKEPFRESPATLGKLDLLGPLPLALLTQRSAGDDNAGYGVAKRWSHLALGVACALLLIMGSAFAQKGTTVSGHASGAFDVKLLPETVDSKPADAALGRMSIDKTFHGALDATSKGAMLSTGNPQGGAAAYVALETVTGTLDGRAGSFVLMHNATMVKGEGTLIITVVPGSGTAALTGLAGRMAVRIEAGKHFYDFDYTLPGKGE